MQRKLISVHDFSGVYAKQPFMQGLQESAASNREIHWLDCTQIAGTDCYCDDEAVKAIRGQITDAGITDARGIHFIDGGNYHYMSKIWTDMVQEPFSLVVFDHHPDMQAPRFGGILSCGGWVLEVLKSNSFVQGVTLIGIADHLVDEIRTEISQTENARVLDKVTFIKESELPAVTLEGAFRRPIGSMDSIAALRLQNDMPLYISIDKDALAPANAATNWDQGSLSTEMLKSIVADLAANHKILGIDICGERARDIEDSRADALNSELNRELAEFLAPFAAS
ncbi:MAG: arginase family protein [Fibrobacter sp.]|uniref:arginase family protein n=1 Tax=Fibrobacter sp. TaxID=35828 RepID=UPI0025BD5AE0|nr:arginase family protein [Fibrobacter sp.]MBR4785909.1 arginase family protein [Fibrobacter sp.]